MLLTTELYVQASIQIIGKAYHNAENWADRTDEQLKVLAVGAGV